MLNRIIAERLREHRRLVVPKLGAFIVKEPDGKILFSELLRGDDGVLRELVKANGVGDIEAAGVIDRFVFEVRNTLDGGRPYVIGELGSLQRGDNGAIVFVPKEAPRAAVSDRRIHAYSAPSVSAARALYDDDANDDRSGAAASGGDANATGRRRRVRRRGADAFVVLAVVIAVLAVAVMVYGYFRANEQEEVSVREMFFPSSASSAEQPYSEPTDLSIPSGAAESADE